MKYGIDFRYLPKGADHTIDNSSYAHPVDVEADDTQFALIPNVGDFVEWKGQEDLRNIPIQGQVRTRFFNYVLGYCYVTIVVEEVDADWDKIRP